MKYSKRVLLGVVGLVSAQFVFALTPVKLALDWYMNPDHAPIITAQVQGYFKAAGLQVTFVEPSSSSSARNLLLSHQVDLALDYAPEALLAKNEGLPVEAVGVLIGEPLNCLGVLESSGIDSMSDLRGKTVAYSGGALERTMLRAELTHAGLAPADVSLLPINMDLSQALLSRRVDAVNGMMRNVEPVLLKQAGANVKCFYAEQNGVPPYPELLFMATQPATVSEATLKTFLAAVAKGATYVRQHPQRSFDEASSAYPTALASSPSIGLSNQAIWLASVPYFTNQPQQYSQKKYTAFMQFLVAQHLLAAPITYQSFFSFAS